MKGSNRIGMTRAGLMALAFLLLSRSVPAQLPMGRLNTVFPAGGQRGTTFAVRLISFADLDEPQTMWFSHPGIRAAPTNVAPKAPRNSPSRSTQRSPTVGTKSEQAACLGLATREASWLGRTLRFLKLNPTTIARPPTPFRSTQLQTEPSGRAGIPTGIASKVSKVNGS